MTKVLRVPASNPLVWQLSLIDRELDEVLRCEPATKKPPLGSRNANNMGPGAGKKGATAKKKDDNRRGGIRLSPHSLHFTHHPDTAKS